MNTIEAGRIGEAAIVSHFVKLGYDVYMPTFGNGKSDLIVTKEDELKRVEVKCSSYERYPGKYEVQLKSVRHNKTQNTIKPFDASKSDFLAVYLPPVDKVVVVDSKEYDGRSTMLVS